MAWQGDRFIENSFKQIKTAQKQIDVTTAKMQAKVIERQKQIELQEQENLRVQRRLEATIKKQAEAKEAFA